jgi:lipid II:glycine glycyltransferase (peptidoglycan interpeptide bridge formation enzyme)
MTSKLSGREGSFFAQERFIEAVVRAEGGTGVRVLKVQSDKSPACIFGLERIHKLNIRSVSLAPFGLPAYPIEYDQSRDSATELVGQLQTTRTLGFDWNVRFDHQDFARGLTECGLKSVEWWTHVLYLDRCYDAVFRNFHASTRNNIRRAERKGVVVRRATKWADLQDYYQIYETVFRERKWTDIYSPKFLEEVFKLSDDVLLLVAELRGTIIGGDWFVRDGSSLFCWQSAMNYKYKHYFPMYAIINYAIRLACAESLTSFNMGGGDIASLEQFKSFWGARKVPIWGFVWKNPVLSPARRVFSKTRRILGRAR